MKKLFGRDKPRIPKVSREHPIGVGVPEERQVLTPIHQQHALYEHQLTQGLRRTSSEEERWEVVSSYDETPLQTPHAPALSPSRTPSLASLPPGASPPIPSPQAPRSPSPFSVVSNPSVQSNKLGSTRDRESQQATLRKKPQGGSGVAALGILRALDPHAVEPVNMNQQTRAHSEERIGGSENGHSYRERERDVGDRREKKGFWGRDKEREKDKERERERDKERERERDKERERERGRDRERDRRDEDSQAELTRMIGYLTATASEDWVLVLEVCDRASANENNAKEAVRALRREFKYGEPPAQLSAARLWAIMLRNSSEIFISQSTSRKFLDTLEDLLTSSRTSPVVRERLIDVLAAAAYASGGKKDGRGERDGFRGLWRKVKPHDKPDEGVPFDTDDAMFNPPVGNPYQEITPVPDVVPHISQVNASRKRKSPTRNRIIPPEEDMRRLFQECQIGQGNALLLSEALVFAKPEDLKKKEIIKEFYLKCRSSQELIYAQIPWASAGAERSRLVKDQEGHPRTFSHSNDHSDLGSNHVGEDPPVQLTTEETLLAALLAANAELIEALKQYDDMERVAMERKAEDRSRKEVRMDRKQLQYLDQEGSLQVEPSGGGGTSSSSRSPSPSPLSNTPPPATLAHPLPRHLPVSHSNLDPTSQSQNLAPPPAAPHGPRSPVQLSIDSRTPSPGTPNHVTTTSSSGISATELQDGLNSLYISHDHLRSEAGVDVEVRASVKPSAKALGKRKVIDAEEADQTFGPDDMLFEHKDDPFPLDDRPLSDQDNSPEGRYQHPVHYVYDAAAERTQQRIQEGHALVNGVH